MSYLTDFLQEELNQILAMAYRAGVWMSHVDDASTTIHDDRREAHALRSAIIRVQKFEREESFTGEILTRILSNQYLWDDWGANHQNFLNDLKPVLFMIDQRLPKDEVILYKKAIFHIAKTVAMAAAEDVTPDEPLSRVMIGGALVEGIHRFLDGLSSQSIPANVSQKEREALQKLRALLKE